MQLTSEQVEALKAIEDVQRDHPNGGAVVRIGGYAGVGKSQTLKTLCEDEEERGHSVVLLAPTGKAALRIGEITGTEAKTVHRWLYKPQVDEEYGTVTYQLAEPSEVERPECGYVVVDEASMIDSQMFQDIYRTALALQLNLVLIGDPFQLPPIKDTFSVFDTRLPTYKTVWMTNVQRQAKESPIIRASMAIRESNWTEAMKDLKVVNLNTFKQMAVESVNVDGVVLVHKNVTRNTMNQHVRTQLGHEGILNHGEALVVTKNSYELDMFNGQVFPAMDVEKISLAKHRVQDKKRSLEDKVEYYTVRVGEKTAILADLVIKGENTVNDYWHEAVANGFTKSRYRANIEKPAYLHANYGYTLTTHKAQGSQFDSVAVLIERSVVHDYRWIYSAITRAKKDLVVSFG